MPVGLNNLNKIDPILVNNVQQQTAEGVVHAYEEARVFKDTNRGKDGRSSGKRMKEKLEKFSSLLKTMDIEVNFIIEGDSIVALNMDGSVLRTYSHDEIAELFSRMKDMIGIFIDIKR